jgi:lysosomal alpha-mannosidase
MAQFSSLREVGVNRAKEAVFQLTAAVGLLNHHDALTGTSKQHVADDYGKIIAAGMTEAESVVASVLAPGSATCRLFNETVCPFSQALTPGHQMFVHVYNPLARSTSSQITVPISFPTAKVSTTDEVPVIVQSTVSSNPGLSSNTAAAPYLLTFTAPSLPALSTQSFIVEVMVDLASPVAESSTVSVVETDSEITVSNLVVAVVFDKQTGLMKSITRMDLGITADVSNDLEYYLSFGSGGAEACPFDNRDPHLQNIKPADHNVGEVSSQRSGAYIFRYASFKQCFSHFSLLFLQAE